MDANAFSPGQEAPSKSPASAHEPEGRRSGVPLSLLTFSDFGHPALRPSGQLRCSSAFQTRTWGRKRK
jgi:hypothetical protein